MNERIKQITGQVLYEVVPETWSTLGYDKIKEIQNRTAELIVKECAEVAHCNFHVDGLTLGGIMKQHFGVKND